LVGLTGSQSTLPTSSMVRSAIVADGVAMAWING
jgi:hypothetical protein